MTEFDGTLFKCPLIDMCNRSPKPECETFVKGYRNCPYYYKIRRWVEEMIQAEL